MDEFDVTFNNGNLHVTYAKLGAMPMNVEVDARDGSGSLWYVLEGRCCNVYDGREFECSACGMQWHLLDRCNACEEWAHVRTPRYCPGCGAKVVKG